MSIGCKDVAGPAEGRADCPQRDLRHRRATTWRRAGASGLHARRGWRAVLRWRQVPTLDDRHGLVCAGRHEVPRLPIRRHIEIDGEPVTLPFPKPAKRGRKPPKGIARKRRPRAMSPKAWITNALDAAWSNSVRGQTGGRCLICWTEHSRHRQGTDAHHVYGKKAHPKLRHVVANGVWLCRECHDWMHAHPARARKIMARVRPTVLYLTEIERGQTT